MSETSPKAAGGYASVAGVFLAGLIGGAVINAFYPVPIWPGDWIRFIGVVPLAVGVWLFVWARSTFRRHRTALMPWTPCSELVQDGPYRFSRNPIYLAFATMYLGFSFVFNSAYILVMLVVALVLFDRLQIPREERYLHERFGAEFDRYRPKVRRWI